MTDLGFTASGVRSEDSSSTQRPEVVGNGVFVAQTDGKLMAYMKLVPVEKAWENDSLLNRQLSNPVMLGQDLIVGRSRWCIAYAEPCDR